MGFTISFRDSGVYQINIRERRFYKLLPLLPERLTAVGNDPKMSGEDEEKVVLANRSSVRNVTEASWRASAAPWALKIKTNNISVSWQSTIYVRRVPFGDPIQKHSVHHYLFSLAAKARWLPDIALLVDTDGSPEQLVVIRDLDLLPSSVAIIIIVLPFVYHWTINKIWWYMYIRGALRFQTFARNAKKGHPTGFTTCI